MQSEVNALVEEVSRIADQTTFNNIKLLNGTYNKSLFVSYQASNAPVSISIDSLNTDFLGGHTFDAGAPGNAFASTQGSRTGNWGFLNDIHTANSTGTIDHIGNNAFVSGAGWPPTFSEKSFFGAQQGVPRAASLASNQAAITTPTAFTYTGYYALQVWDSAANQFVSQASNAIAIIDSSLNSVLLAKSLMGAKENEMTAIGNNIDNVIETTSAARSRIQDADFAQETANMTKYMILQQSGIAVLAQANQLPQQILQLLK
ncbi:MAG: hypothetical protein HQK89_10355 [Nitrospirae bacterium]|nr:hypothetical protein [Nitrospirota bacterium]